VSHFRTITAVVEIQDDSELRHTGSALLRARYGLEDAGFVVWTVRNEPNQSGDLPPAKDQIGA